LVKEHKKATTPHAGGPFQAGEERKKNYLLKRGLGVVVEPYRDRKTGGTEVAKKTLSTRDCPQAVGEKNEEPQRVKSIR